jgi:hypothetical protein
MIQLNLLPDVKLEYIKAQKTRTVVISLSIIISSLAFAILVIMLGVSLWHKHTISNLNSDITSNTAELKSRPSLNGLLTVQTQLASLSRIDAQRPDIARLFDTYLSQVTPESASLNQMSLTFAGDTATLTGSADSIVTINKFVDTLKLTTYGVGSAKSSTPAFSNIVLTSFGLNSSATDPDQAANYTINLDFAPSIFNSAQNVTLTVPNIIVTHSEDSDDSSLFASKEGQ